MFERHARIGHHRNGSNLVSVELRRVDVDEAHVRILKRRHRSRREIGVARADPDHQVGRVRQPVGGQRSRRADRAHRLRMVPGQRTFARLSLRNRNAGLRNKFVQRRRGLAHQHAATGDDQRPLRSANRCNSPFHRHCVGLPAANQPHALAEQLFRIVEGLGLHILGQRQRNRAAIGGRSEHPHHLRQCRDQLLGPIDAVPVPRHRLEAIVDADILRARRLHLLQDRRNVAARENVAGQQQHRQPVHRCQRRAGNHVGRAGPDRRGAGKGAHPVAGLGKRRRQVHARLFVAHQDVFEIGVLLQRLPNARHVSVTEDAQHSSEECMLLPVPLDVLILQKQNQRLRHRHATRIHTVSPQSIQRLSTIYLASELYCRPQNTCGRKSKSLIVTPEAARRPQPTS